jgi:hypothetical protein
LKLRAGTFACMQERERHQPDELRENRSLSEAEKALTDRAHSVGPQPLDFKRPLQP